MTGGLGAAVPRGPSARPPDGVDAAAGGAAAPGVVVTVLGAIAGGAAAAPGTEGIAGGGRFWRRPRWRRRAPTSRCSRGAARWPCKGVASIRAAQHIASIWDQRSLLPVAPNAKRRWRRRFQDQFSSQRGPRAGRVQDTAASAAAESAMACAKGEGARGGNRTRPGVLHDR